MSHQLGPENLHRVAFNPSFMRVFTAYLYSASGGSSAVAHVQGASGGHAPQPDPGGL